MYSPVLLLHSINRYLVLIALINVIFIAFTRWSSKSPFTPTVYKSSLLTLILTHIQLLLGLLLFFISPIVQFSGASMKDDILRYWLAEHSVMMLIAVVLITISHVSMKKMQDDAKKLRRIWLFNGLALVVIIVTILLSGRGLFSVTGYF